MTRWEYCQQGCEFPQIKEVMDRAGRDGWECCGLLSVNFQESLVATQQVPGAVIYFKRPLNPGVMQTAKDKANGQGARSHQNGSAGKFTGGAIGTSGDGGGSPATP